MSTWLNLLWFWISFALFLRPNVERNRSCMKSVVIHMQFICFTCMKRLPKTSLIPMQVNLLSYRVIKKIFRFMDILYQHSEIWEQIKFWQMIHSWFGVLRIRTNWCWELKLNHYIVVREVAILWTTRFSAPTCHA